MSDQLPLISVIVPCYNQGRYLEDAIASLIAQTYRKWECLILNDGSTDDTHRIALKLARSELRIRYFEHANCGPSATRNRGINEANGEYIQFLDADDKITPNALSTLVAAAKANPGIGVLCGGFKEIDTDGNLIAAVNMPKIEPDVFHQLLSENIAPCHAFLVRRNAILAIGAFDASLPACEDWDLWIRLAANQTLFASIGEYVAIYRRYAGSNSTNLRRMFDMTSIILNKAAHHHPQCDICRLQIKDSHRHYRLLYLHRATFSYRQERRWVAGTLLAIRFCIESQLHDSGFLPAVLARLGKRIWRRTGNRFNISR